MPTHLRRHDEPGHIHFLTISCYHRLPFFERPEIRTVVVQSMADARRRIGFRWIGYVVMPEHVHWLIYPRPLGSPDMIPISTVLQSLKTSIGRRVTKAWRNVWAQQHTLGHAGLDRWATAGTDTKPIWTTRGIDFNVTGCERLMQKLDYCHNNPVTRHLVDHPAKWPWSSFNYYQTQGDVSLGIDWDGSWPLE